MRPRFRIVAAGVYYRVWRSLAERLDRWAIRQACSAVVSREGNHHEREAEQLLAEPDFFRDPVEVPRDLQFSGPHDFSFASQRQTAALSNNTVHGRLYRAGRRWREKPAVILLHGWNSELSYTRQFPFLAWRLNRHGVNAAMFELPFHGRRRPSLPGAINNFISHDLLSMIEASRQALVDARTIASWLLEEEGCPLVGVWGISLGAWLGGLLLCSDPRIDFGVLMTPVPNIEMAVRELDFCAPIRAALQSQALDVSRLNLAMVRPLTAPQNILIIQAQHDIFAPAEIVDELWTSWARPPIWRVAHGHISILMSLRVMERTVRWVAETSQKLLRRPVSTVRAS